MEHTFKKDDLVLIVSKWIHGRVEGSFTDFPNKYRIRTSDGHIQTVDEENLAPLETTPEIEEENVKELIKDGLRSFAPIDWLKYIGILLIIVAIAWKVTQSIIWPPPQVVTPQPKSKIELIQEELAELQKSKTPEFTLQKKAMGIFNESVGRVKKIDEKVNEKTLDLYAEIKK